MSLNPYLNNEGSNSNDDRYLQLSSFYDLIPENNMKNPTLDILIQVLTIIDNELFYDNEKLLLKNQILQKLSETLQKNFPFEYFKNSNECDSPSNNDIITKYSYDLINKKRDIEESTFINSRKHPKIEKDIEESTFITGSRKLQIDDVRNGKHNSSKISNVRKKFVNPSVKNENGLENVPSFIKKAFDNEDVPGQLKNVEPKLVEMISNEIIDSTPGVNWSDIIGLEFAKQAVFEAVIWPLQRPEFFQGLRTPPRGILLFGPPGTGKTMIGKAIASEAKATFFSISAASLTSKWHGESEKMIRALFGVAILSQPAVIFIDEIDSLLCQRSDTDFEATRRSKTEFLVQLDGLGNNDGRLLVVGATNRPQDIDEAARRRLVKRLYIPLPDSNARFNLLKHLLKKASNTLSDEDISTIISYTDGADINSLCKDAAMGPIRELSSLDIHAISTEQIRPINFTDFEKSLNTVKSSVSPDQIFQYENWNSQFGSFSEPK